jgi:hypothetical protein
MAKQRVDSPKTCSRLESEQALGSLLLNDASSPTLSELLPIIDSPKACTKFDTFTMLEEID